ncbi:oxidoreductase family protein [Trematosphaeria pertusa]|uniref:Oxidoreductase family protein n=1 Tax=Trematosphaeria pertusa TaxID=390896 RepID=A0A6A6HW22_9PLEO|nr:oxidoreductase family protein [Trematosphaeria pertusa]KAF2241932.1 oxidoreductase family protein [Trematosphaeria pertusa]
MAPLRTALIGLSASAKVTWAADAHLAYLLSPRGRQHFSLTALLNSSVSAAEAAKREFQLPERVKTYGDPAALAADSDVDLVVCCTRVDVHFPTIAPALRAGKGVYVEWPVAENLARALELTQGVGVPNSVVGLQGRVMPVALRLKEILAAGTIGAVLSSDVKAFGNLLARDGLPEGLTYFADRRVGGHPVNISWGHTIDYVHEVLGEFEDFRARMQIQRPQLKVFDAEGREKGMVKSDVPDLLALHGTLKKSEGRIRVVDGAVLSATFRLGPPFKGEPGFVWTINGEKGELLITAPGPYIFSGDSYNGPVSIKLHDHLTHQVRELGWEWQDWQKELPIRARITGEVYERYAEWVENGMGEVKEGREWPRLGDGLERMREFERLYGDFDPNWK